MNLSLTAINLIGAITALSLIVLAILIFIFRLYKLESAEFVTGLLFMLCAIPLIYLLIQAPNFDKPSLYYIQIILMLIFILTEFLLDYVFKYDFRHTQWMVVTYVTVFFASLGGMVGVASLSGRSFTIAAVMLFLIMTILAFYQRAKTGL